MDTFTADQPGQRLDVFLARALPDTSRSVVAQWIAAGRVSVDGKVAGKAGQKLTADAHIEVHIPPPPPSHLDPEDGPLDLLHEDDDLAVLVKPAGLSVHPAGPRRTGTLVNRLLAHFNQLSEVGGPTRPGLVHRLDQDTSGVMVVAKNDVAHRALSAQFAARTVLKEYLAIMRGEFHEAGPVTVDAPIARHPRDRKKMAVVRDGRNAKTTVHVLAGMGHHSLVVARIHTGRTHQIRVHLSYVGHPVLGDATYGYRPEAQFRLVVQRAMKRRRGAYLHAWRLGFDHPGTGERMAFAAPPPEDFQKLLVALQIPHWPDLLEQWLARESA